MSFICSECKKVFFDIQHFKMHERTHASSSKGIIAKNTPQETTVKIIKSAFKSRIITLSYSNNKEECLIPDDFINEACRPLKEEVDIFLKKHNALKINIELHALYSKPNMDDLENTPLEVKYFQTKMQEIFNMAEFDNIFIRKTQNILKKMEEFQERDSGWTLVQLIKIELNLNKYQPLKGKSFIPLPRKLLLKKACINVQNQDNFCFKWAVVSAVADLKNSANQPSNYKINITSNVIYIGGYCLNFEGLCFPLKLKDINIFENNNQNISINVFGYNEKEDLLVGPYYKANAKKTKHINLMFLQKHVGEEIISHYIWIKNISR